MSKQPKLKSVPASKPNQGQPALAQLEQKLQEVQGALNQLVMEYAQVQYNREANDRANAKLAKEADSLFEKISDLDPKVRQLAQLVEQRRQQEQPEEATAE